MASCMMRLFNILCFLTLLLPMAATACPHPDCVRIGSWNIEWLGSSNRQLADDTATTDRMAKLIADNFSIDLLVLEEINTELDGSTRNEQFSLEPWHHLRAALEQRGYQLQAGSSGHAQHIVFAWRKPVVSVAASHELDVPDHFELDNRCHSSQLRKPLTGLFRAGNTEIRLVGVHLKAQGEQALCSTAIRSQQIQIMAQQLGLPDNMPRHLIIAGDFNMTARHPEFQPLTRTLVMLDDSRYRSAASGNTSHISPDNLDSHVMIDHILASPDLLGSWIAQSTVAYRPDDIRTYMNSLSDHVPVWTDFSVSGH